MTKDRLTIVFVCICLFVSTMSAVLYYFNISRQSLSSDFEVSPATEQKMGKIRQKSNTQLQYILSNTSRHPLKIIDASTTCGCTTTNISKKDVSPGDSVDIFLNFNSRDYRGTVHAHALILYEDTVDRERRSIELHAVGEIDPEYIVEPAKVKFVGREKYNPVRVTIHSQYVKDFEVKSVTCDKRFFTANIIRRNTRNVEVEVLFDPSKYYIDAGPANLTIETNSPILPIAYIPLETEL